MPGTDPTRGRWTRLTRSLSAKLITLLLAAMLAIFALLGYFNIRLHRQHLEAATLASAERLSDVIKSSTAYYMLRDDREGLYHAIETIAHEPGMLRVRIIDRDGRISYSTDPHETSLTINKKAEACYGCHAESQPLSRLNRPDRFRIYRDSTGERVLGIITPIENQPNCANSACHAHPSTQQILGVLDTDLSLAKPDAQLAESTRQMVAYTLLALAAVGFLSWVFVWRVVDQPINALRCGTKHLSKGDLGFQITVRSQDEVGELARSFNSMSQQLRVANDQTAHWAKTLEERVEQKTRELKRAHEEVLHIEKMATIGKMAAVVAHEINNPLSGILTYAKLLRKWLTKEDLSPAKQDEAVQCLDLIAGESRRCGDLVKNLLTFSRTSPINLESTDLSLVVDRTVRLVQHQLDLAGIHLQLDIEHNLPVVMCDAAQIEQVLIALIMNAIDAMPHGGNLWITVQKANESEIWLQVRDDGVGIVADLLPHIFEPFLTTKESGHGAGLGLAITRSIVERHQGHIEVQSELGQGTSFAITLPIRAESPVVAPTELAEMNVR